jgi:hypothetical protein
MHAGSVTMSAVKDRLGTSSGGAATQAATPVVYLIERDPRTLEHLSGQLTGRGYLVHCFRNLEGGSLHQGWRHGFSALRDNHASRIPAILRLPFRVVEDGAARESD